MRTPVAGHAARWARAWVVAAIAAAGLAGAAGAQPSTIERPEDSAAVFASQPGDSALEARVRGIAGRLRCPVCQGLSLQDSPSELAQQMRGLVRNQLRAGRTPEQIERYFVERYGEWILMEPRAAGFNWVVYGLPAIMLLAGAGVVVVLLRRWTGTPLPPDGKASAPR